MYLLDILTAVIAYGIDSCLLLGYVKQISGTAIGNKIITATT
jgi:hypothetical protein